MADNKKKRLLIIGAGGHGAVAADCAQLMNEWSEICFLDARWPDQKKIYNWEIIGKDDYYTNKTVDNDVFFVGIGNTKTRMQLIQIIKKNGLNLVSIIHPLAIISGNASILDGTLIAAGAIVNIGSRIEVGCIVNTGAKIDHDCIIEEGAHICPGVNIAGNVHVGKRTWVGIGTTVSNGIKIGKNSFIGAGSVVIKNIPDNITVVGVPAKKLIRENKNAKY